MARVGCCRPGLHIPSPLGEAWSVRAKVTSSHQTFPQPLSHTLAAQGLLCWLPPEHLAHLVTPVSLLALTNDRADPRSTATATVTGWPTSLASCSYLPVQAKRASPGAAPATPSLREGRKGPERPHPLSPPLLFPNLL